jgi:hypothetical protein
MSEQPQRIRLSRARGWRLPENAVHVGRPSRWGNPFIVGKHGTRIQCATMFAQLAGGFISFSQEIDTDLQLTMYRRIRRHIGDLAGKDLACWCPLDGGACHADVLLLLANPGFVLPDWMKQPIDLPHVRLGMTASNIEQLKRAATRKSRRDVPNEDSNHVQD